MLLVLLGLSPLGAGGAEGLEKVRMAYPSAGLAMGPAWIATDLGFFREEGLDVEMPLITGGTTIVQALLGGSIQAGVAVGAPPVVAAIAQGAELTVAAVSGNRLDYVLVSRAPVKHPGELAGKRFAITALGSATEMVTRLALEKLGVNPESVVMLGIGGAALRTAALAAGRVDATVIPENELVRVQDQGFHVLLDLARSDLEYPVNTLVVTKQFAAQKRTLVLGMIRGLVKGVRFMRANQEESIRIASRWLKTADLDSLRRQWRPAVFSFWQEVPRATEPGFRLAVKGLVAGNPKVAELRMADVFDASFVDELEKSGFFGKQ